MNAIGIDVGAKGALALLSPGGELLDVVDMPILHDGPARRPNVNAPLLSAIVSRWKAGMVYVEFVGARPKEGPTGAFAFGRSKGVIEGVCAAAGLPVAFLAPPTWKRAVGIPPGKDGAKDAARSEAIRRWPSKADLFARVKDDGRAEAALIAVAGMAKAGAENTARKQRGPGKPFKKGESGNPAGKPKGTRHKVTQFAEKLMQDDAENIVNAVLTAARNGDMTAARLVLDRIIPARQGATIRCGSIYRRSALPPKRRRRWAHWSWQSPPGN